MSAALTPRTGPSSFELGPQLARPSQHLLAGDDIGSIEVALLRDQALDLLGAGAH
jgi:hypothetical protein